MSRRLRLAVLPALCSLALAALPVAAQPGPAGRLDLDPRPQRAPLRLPADLFGGDAPAQGELRVKLGVRKIKYSRVLDTAPLALGQESAGQPGHDLPLATADGASGLAFGRYNEVAVDYRDADPDNPALASLTVRAPDGRSFASDPLECVERLGEAYLAGAAAGAVPVARAGWAEKNVLYLARRVLDLPYDDIWRVAEDGPSTFLQRRFDRDILDLGAVDLILRRPAPVQVNLVAALDPANPRSRTVLDWYALAKRTFELPDGRTVLRVYVGRYLRERFPGLKAVRLKEVSLMFFRQGAAEVARDRLVERLVFTPSGLDPSGLAADGLPGRLPTRVREPFAGTKRLFVNIAAVSKAMGPDGRATAGLRLAPMTPALPGGATVEGAFLALVSPRRDTPAYLAAADELATSLGASPDIDRADGGQTVTALWSLDAPFPPGQRRARALDGAAPEAEPVFASGLDGLFAAEGGTRLYRTKDGLTVEGRADRLAMAVDAAFSPSPENAYFFRLDIAPGPGLTGIFLDVPDAADPAAVKSYALRPGAPTPLPDLPARVAGAAVRFTFAGREFSLALTRAMLVAVPRARAHEGLYAARLPWPVATAGQPVPAAAGETAFAPKTPFGRLSWLTAGFELTGDPVAVSIAGGSPAVPDTRAGRLAGRLPGDGKPAGLAVSGRAGQAPGRLELADPVFSGQAPADWRELFAAGPLVTLNDHPHGPGLLSEATAGRLHAADDWLDLGPAALPVRGGQARFFEHPWYGVSALCFETKATLDLARFAAPAKPGGGSGGLGTLGRVVAGALLAGAAGMGLRLAGRRRLSQAVAAPIDWLGGIAGAPAAPGRQARLWLGLSAGLALAGLGLGGVAGRPLLGLAGAALLPVWRVLARPAAARLSRRLPPLGGWLDADAGRLYFLGFALALAAAAVLRGLLLAGASEFCFQAGLYCFLAGLCLEIVRSRREPPGQEGHGRQR